MTPENQAITELVVEIADAWARGEIGLESVRRQCDGWDRFVAMNHARSEVAVLIDALVDDDNRRKGLIETKHGLFTPQDIRENGGIHGPINGRDTLRWPSSGYPGHWRYGEKP